ncbi:MAG: hypothetical protein R3A48_15160 [Polyangiales bacterium]
MESARRELLMLRVLTARPKRRELENGSAAVAELSSTLRKVRVMPAIAQASIQVSDGALRVYPPGGPRDARARRAGLSRAGDRAGSHTRGAWR